MVDLLQQQRLLGGKLFGPVARFADFRIGRLLGAHQGSLGQRLGDGRAQQLQKAAAGFLDDVIRRPVLESRHRDPALVRAGDIDDRRQGGQLVQVFERGQAHPGPACSDPAR